MTASYAYVPIGYATGLTCAIFSYDQKLFFSLTSDTKLMPDLQTRLKPFLEQSFSELRDLAGVTQIEAPAPKLPRATVEAAVTPRPEVTLEPSAVTIEVASTVVEVGAKASESEPITSPFVSQEELGSKALDSDTVALPVIVANPVAESKASLPKTVMVKAPARKKSKKAKDSITKEPVTVEA